MEIYWLGHSCLRIHSADTVLVTDPFDKSIGISMSVPKADIVTISHDHPHHANTSAIGGSPRILNGPGEYEIGSVHVSGMGSQLGESAEDRKINTIYSIRAEGLTICHLGDLSNSLSPRQAQELNKADVLIVPAGENGTISINRISAVINLIDPRIVIPVHYQTKDVKVELSPLEPFLNEMGVTDVSPVNRLNVTSTNLPREIRTVVLQRAS